MSPESSVPAPSQALISAAEPSYDQMLISGWLAQAPSKATRRGYKYEIDRLFAFLGHGTPRMRDVTAMDLIRYRDALKTGKLATLRRASASEAVRFAYDAAVQGVAAVMDESAEDAQHGEPKAATVAHAIAAVRALFKFVVREVGYLQLNPAAVLKSHRVSSDLAQRILPAHVVKYIVGHTSGREHVMCLMLYTTGVRVAELCGMKWRDVRERADGSGQVTVTGKGEKMRTILLDEQTWAALRHMRPADASGADPVFRSRKGGHLSTTQVFRLIQEKVPKQVRAAAVKDGKAYIADAIPENLSPHWFRHAHASHALDNKCPIHVLQSTLGHSSIAITSRYLHANPDDSSAKYIRLEEEADAA